MRYISFGSGTQSTAMLLASDAGLIPRADCAIFADTGDEPAWVYENLERVKAVVKNIPIEVVSHEKGGLGDRITRATLHGRDGHREPTIPAWTNTGPLMRTCTEHHKIEVIQRRVRAMLGYKKGQRIPPGSCEVMIGISLDEADRMKPSRDRWVVNQYPLIYDLAWRRPQCVDYIALRGLPEPGKSSCVFCPYHSDNMWKALKQRHPDEWNKAIAFDALIRDSSKRGIKKPVFLHRSCVPLAEANLNENQGELFGEECTGYCGV